MLKVNAPGKNEKRGSKASLKPKNMKTANLLIYFLTKILVKYIFPLLASFTEIPK